MKFRLWIVVLAAVVTTGCSVEVLAPPTPQGPPTPSQGGVTQTLNIALPDLRVGASGNGCGPLAADLSGQTVAATVTAFLNQPNGALRAIANNGHYTGSAAILGSNCQPTGTRYDLAAAFGADYTGSLGKNGNDICLSQSNLVITSFQLQGLPDALTALTTDLVSAAVSNLVQPQIENLVVTQLNGGRLPASGARCPGA